MLATLSQQPADASLPTSFQDEAVWEFDSWGVDLPATLRLLSELVGGAAIRPGVNCKGAFCTALRPQLPAGACGGGRLMLGGGMQMPA